MKSNGPAALAAYLMAVFMGLVPLLDTVLGLLPPRIGDIAWRYGTVGVVVDASMVPLLGLALAAGLALVLKQRYVLRVVAGVAGTGALTTLVVLVLFLLDSAEMRAILTDAVRLPFDVATASSAVKMLVIIVFGFAVSQGGWSAARVPRHREKQFASGTILMGTEESVKANTRSR